MYSSATHTHHSSYNRLTLKLNDSTLYKEFYKFTIDEIIFTLPYFVIIYSSMMVISFQSEDLKTQMSLFCPLFFFLMAILLLRNKCREYLMYCFLLLSLATYGVIFFILMTTTSDGEYLNQLFTKQPSQLMRFYVAFGGFVIPNYKWLTFYGCISIVAKLALKAKFTDLGDDNLKETLEKLPGSLINCFICYHYVMNMRLDKFFRERRLIMQKSQMTDVFNS